MNKNLTTLPARCKTCNETYCVSKISLFSHLSLKHMETVIKKIDRRKYQKGDFLFQAGDAAKRLWILNEGSIKVFNYTQEGKEQILYLLSSGDFLGDLNLFKENAYPYYATALEPTRLCTLSRDNFQEILKEVPAINKKVLAYAYDRITNLEELVQTVTAKNVGQRIAKLLLHFLEHFGLERKGILEITFPMSREDMANYLGLTRETVSRQLSQFQSEGIIDMKSNRQIIVKNKKALEDYSL
ncbi:Crp/Fnr family transcriptional regulator [Isachenkonia alkalipeptolytica]|nr:Crp/Fnr family transcriptional regulator [Isachenkonia alkalipeptolytica]